MGGSPGPSPPREPFYEDRAQVSDPLQQRASQLEPDSAGSISSEDGTLFPCGTATVFR